tara:strand:- start:11618 stop:11929 length:312 start_codon:yes stop_codon:yes gene_type:complete
MATKYWLGKSPNGEVTDAQIQALKSLSTADLDALDDLSIPMVAEADVSAPTAYTAVTNMTANVAKAEGEAISASLATAVTEMTAIEDKLNALLAKLRTAGLLA